MKIILLICLSLLVTFLAEVEGCHPLKPCKRGKKHGGGHDDNCIEDDDDDDQGDVGPKRPSRKKRQAQAIDPFTKFFVDCLGRYQFNTQYDLPTIVDFTLRKTSWFGKTSEQYCVGDAVDCWIFLLNSYLTENSQFLTPAKSCIDEYGISKGRPSSPQDGGTGIDNFGENQNTLPVSVPQFSSRLKSQYQPKDFEDRSVDDVESLVRFINDEVGCALDFCNCENMRVPKGEACGQNWYTRIAAITTPSSDLRPIITKVANQGIQEAIAPTGGPATTPFTLPTLPPNILTLPPIPSLPPFPPFQPQQICQPLRQPISGQLSCTNGFQSGSQCSVICRPGFMMSGAPTFCWCQTFSIGCQWSGPPPTCSPRTPPPTQRPNLLLPIVLWSLFTTTETPKIDCNNPANFEKTECVDCEEDRYAEHPLCLIDCKDPSNSDKPECDCALEENITKIFCKPCSDLPVFPCLDCKDPKYKANPGCRGQ